MSHHTKAKIGLLSAAVLVTGVVIGEPVKTLPKLIAAESDSEPKRQKIDKLYFMFHPVCWRMHGPKPPAGADPQNWTACYTRELRVNEAQKKFISQMKTNAALVLFPIGTSPPMRALEEHASQELGRRCIIVRREGKDPPRSWANLANPIERFLNDPHLEGRAEFLKGVPSEIQAELETEIRKALVVRTGKCNISVLDVVYYSRLCAMDIQSELKKHNLFYDPATVRS